ncbi:MAG: c-type cytochrome [Bacteroidetes bacterium]|nr:c-type cytochrome [Bacteroidota bacterium]
METPSTEKIKRLWLEVVKPRMWVAFVPHSVLFLSIFVGIVLAFFLARWYIHTQPFSSPPVEVYPLLVALPESAPDPEYNIRTPEKVDLGHKLFFDVRLSRSKTVSCNTCHILQGAGVDHRTVSVGEQHRAGTRNTPTVFNAAFLPMQFWDGRVETLEQQAALPLITHHEMDMTPEELVNRLLASGYLPYFASAFPDEDEPVSYQNVTFALAAFQRTLITPNARFDQYLAGNHKILSEKELRGLKLFQEAQCATCHYGPLLGGNTFMEFSHGISDDRGRGNLEGHADEANVFRVAPLRNVTLTYPYFHDGSVATIESAVGMMVNEQVRRPFNVLEVREIVAFLRTLEGEFPAIAHPRLPDDVPVFEP